MSLRDELAAEAAAAARVPSAAESKDLATLATELANVDKMLAEAVELQKQLSKRKIEITMRELPDLMTQYGQDRIGVPGLDVDFVLEPYYHANIKAEWPEEQREKAFDYLIGENAGDLIKAVVTVTFGREDFEKAKALAAELKANGYDDVDFGKNVQWNTLTAWLREQVENGKVVPLETIGATLGQVVKLKKRKK